VENSCLFWPKIHETPTDKSEMTDKIKSFSGFHHRFVPGLSLEGFSRDKGTGQGQKDKDKGQDIPANRMVDTQVA